MTSRAIDWCVVLAVARDAPAHVWSIDHLNDFLIFHVTVALFALFASIDVALVREVDVLRKVVVLEPFDIFLLLNILGE